MLDMYNLPYQVSRDRSCHWLKFILHKVSYLTTHLLLWKYGYNIHPLLFISDVISSHITFKTTLNK